MMMESPSTLSGICGKGLGGGPEVTFPERSYVPAWQGQRNLFLSFWNSTRHPRWVQTRDSATNPLSGLLTTMPGEPLNTMSFASPMGISFLLRTSCFAPASPAGGEKYLARGYKKEARAVKPSAASSLCKNSRRVVMIVWGPHKGKKLIFSTISAAPEFVNEGAFF